MPREPEVHGLVSLMEIQASRAAALGMAFGPAPGLELANALAAAGARGRLPPAAERARRPAGEAQPRRRARAEFERGRR
jgi:predicted RNA polymerase sigma factor